jgi:signal transduction histidine kinase
MMTLLAIVTRAGQANVITNIAGAALAFGLLIYSYRSGHYRRCYIISISVIFLGFFPLLFFTSEGYRGGMPSFFIFAVLFTVFMLEGKLAVIMTALEIVVYTALCVYAYFFPEQLRYYPTELDRMTDIVFSYTIVSVIIGVTMFLHFRMYNEQQRKLDEQNDMLAKANSAKTEFLQDIGHEIRNPLQVIAYGVDFIRGGMDGGTEEALDALNTIQNEAVRLGNMINGMVELATISGNPASRAKTDFAAMLRHSAEAARPLCEQKRDALRVEIAPGLPSVYAVAEQLARVPVNLLQNAINATEGGEISVMATLAEGRVTVGISDSGTGIAPELLPRVFERGVSGGGGKGYGLSICKTIVEAHGGAIEIESKRGKGTTVTFTVPVYGGQSEARA